MNDKMRAAIEVLRSNLLDPERGAAWYGIHDNTATREAIDTLIALSQQPESEPVGHAMEANNPKAPGLTIATFNANRVPVGTALYTSPQPSAQVPESVQNAIDFFDHALSAAEDSRSPSEAEIHGAALVSFIARTHVNHSIAEKEKDHE